MISDFKAGAKSLPVGASACSARGHIFQRRALFARGLAEDNSGENTVYYLLKAGIVGKKCARWTALRR